MKSFWLNCCSGRQERWALEEHRWVAAEPRRNGFDLWGYQDDTPEIAYLGSGAHEEQLQKLADQFLWGDPERSTFSFFLNALPIYSSAWRWRCRIESERRSAQRLEEERRLRPERKRPNIGKVLDELAKQL
jgi:hypothetical protein